MKITACLGLAVAAFVLSVQVHAQSADKIMYSGFEDETTDGFNCEFPGAGLSVSDIEFSNGSYGLKCTGDKTVDVEKYLKFTDNGTKIGFNYRADGMKAIRVLASSQEDAENLYFNLLNVPQGKWCWCVIKFEDLKNVVPRHGGIDMPFGQKSGKGKTFKNIVFHITDTDKNSEQPTVYLDNIVIYNSPDKASPSKVEGLGFDSEGTKPSIFWTDAKDNVAVAYYKVYKGAEPGFKPDKNSALDTVVIPEIQVPKEKAYYRVSAVDYDGNEGEVSESLEVK